MSRYIDPLTDFSFKRLFGAEPNKDLLIDFLNAVFEGRKKIVDIVYNKNEYVGDTDKIGSVIFDLTCTSDKGATFLIEVQRTNQYNIKKRMLYYAGKLIADQAPKGNRSAWNYGISDVFIIVIMDGFNFSSKESKDYLYSIALCDKNTGQLFENSLGFEYIELRNFVKESADLQSNLDKWLYVLKNLSSLKKLPLFLRKQVFIKMFNIAEYSKMTQEEREMYDVSLKKRWDAYNVRETARLQGLEKGELLGFKKGELKGRQEGELKGRQEGELKGRQEGELKGRQEEALKHHKEKLVTAKKLKARGLSLAEIAEITGLTAADLADLD